MDITKINHSGVQGLLANIYNAPNQPQNIQSKESEQHLTDVNRIEDKSSPSAELQKAREIGGELQGGFNDKTSFENLASTLRKKGLISSNEQVAMEYLKKNATKLSFDEFDKIAVNDNHSKEMKGLIDSVVNTMKFVDSVNGGGVL